MKRFLIFPPLFAVWFIAAQFGLRIVSWCGIWLTFRLSPPIDFYWHAMPVSLAEFVPAIIAGIGVGVVFATLEFAFHRRYRVPNETAIQLLRNLIKSGTIAVTLILICQGVSIWLFIHPLHRRYHAYPPEMTWLNTIHLLQPLILLLSLFWAMGKTLKVKKKNELSAD